MSNSNANTLPTLETLTELLQSFRQEVVTRLDGLENTVREMKQDLAQVKDEVRNLAAQVEELGVQTVGFDVRQERLTSQLFEVSATVHGNRADIKVLTAEVRAWAKDVMALQGVTGGLRS